MDDLPENPESFFVRAKERLEARLRTVSNAVK